MKLQIELRVSDGPEVGALYPVEALQRLRETLEALERDPSGIPGFTLHHRGRGVEIRNRHGESAGFVRVERDAEGR